MDRVQFLSHECLRKAYERIIVSFGSNSLMIVPYVRKSVIAFYGPTFASSNRVPQKRCRSGILDWIGSIKLGVDL